VADKLNGVHPMLAARVVKILDVMRSAGFPMMVTEGVRTSARQRELYAQGRTAPGAIVTQCDGVTTVSNHQIRADGYGRAVDLAFVVNGGPSWDDKHPWRLYGELAAALGLAWGGKWITHPDRPHIELPDRTLDRA
jgi:peptidoglycan L-alanyl-D-glutamate endopeptidase CwlK